MSRAALLAAAAAWTLVSCGPAAPVPASAPSAAARELAGDEGVELVQACTPTGPELCFNAIDDNCNGVIDEGCGVATGTLQVVIAWGEAGANVDLSLTEPGGATVSAQTRALPSGFKLDHDCPADGCSGQNEETVYFEGAEPPRGRYRLEMRMVELGGAALPVVVRLGVRASGRTFGAKVPLSHKDDKKSVTFVL